MNLDKIFEWVIVIVIGFSITGNLDKLTHWIYKAQAKLMIESRTSSWGSPTIFNNYKD